MVQRREAFKLQLNSLQQLIVTDPFADLDTSSEDDGGLEQNEAVLEDNCWLVF